MVVGRYGTGIGLELKVGACVFLVLVTFFVLLPHAARPAGIGEFVRRPLRPSPAFPGHRPPRRAPLCVRRGRAPARAAPAALREARGAVLVRRLLAPIRGAGLASRATSSGPRPAPGPPRGRPSLLVR